MTYNALIPLNSDSPSIFPAQSQANFTRLQTIISADHQFNLTAAANDGYHNLIHMTQQAPSGALAATGRYYAKSSAGRIHAFYMDDTGAEYQITPAMPIRAAANFNGTGAVGAQTLRSTYNITSVVKVSTGVYTVNFTTAMPNDGYIVHLTGMRALSGRLCFGDVIGDATYGNSVTTTSLKIVFFNTDDTPVDVLMGNITVFSVT